MLTNFVFAAMGLFLLFLGGELVLRGSIALSQQFGISKLVTGLVIVGFGTSLPELVVFIGALSAGSPGIGIGNVVGSCSANVLFITGVAALIFPISGWDQTALRGAMAGAIAGLLLLVSMVCFQEISPITGFLFLLLLAGYLLVSYRAEKNAREDSEFLAEIDELAENSLLQKFWFSALIVILGIGLLVFGSDFLVDSATVIARDFGVSEAVIGLSLVAVGTSLPELATAISAALRKHTEIVLGNIIGSNLFNILFILGLTSLARPIPVPENFGVWDVPIMVVLLFFLFLLLRTCSSIGRSQAAGMLIAYAGYLWFLFAPAA